MILLTSILTIFLAFGQLSANEYPYSHDVNKNYLIEWNYDLDTVTIKLTVKTISWIGIGFSPDGIMAGADIIMGGVKNGKGYILDTHAKINGPPLSDKLQNVDLVDSSQIDGQTSLTFKRKFITGDSKNDREIMVGNMTIIWAYGFSDLFKVPSYTDYHWWRRGKTIINLVPELKEEEEREIKYSEILGKDVELEWYHDDKDITFTLTAPTSGWIGFGFSPKGTMAGADIIIGGVRDDREYYFDAHATQNGTPQPDLWSNIELLEATQSSGRTTIVVRRKLQTRDDKDRDIKTGSVNLIWAYGKTDIRFRPGRLNYHFTNRGMKRITLLRNEDATSRAQDSTTSTTTTMMTTTNTTFVPKTTQDSTTSTTTTMMTTTNNTIVPQTTQDSTTSTTTTMMTTTKTTAVPQTTQETTTLNITMGPITNSTTTISITTAKITTSSTTMEPTPNITTTISTMTPKTATSNITMEPTLNTTTTISTIAPKTAISNTTMEPTLNTTTTISTITPTTTTSTTTKITLDTTTKTSTTAPNTTTSSSGKATTFGLDGRVKFSWRVTDKKIIIGVTAPIPGWVGVGFSPGGTMAGADLILAGVRRNRGYIVDAHADANGVPDRDRTANVRLLMSSQSGRSTTVMFERDLITGDPDDLDIKPGEMYVLWAYGNRDIVGDPAAGNKHRKKSRGAVRMELL